jgi:hypothetical protein
MHQRGIESAWPYVQDSLLALGRITGANSGYGVLLLIPKTVILAFRKREQNVSKTEQYAAQCVT